jgi:hypothetical protein
MRCAAMPAWLRRARVSWSRSGRHFSLDPRHRPDAGQRLALNPPGAFPEWRRQPSPNWGRGASCRRFVKAAQLLRALGRGMVGAGAHSNESVNTLAGCRIHLGRRHNLGVTGPLFVVISVATVPMPHSNWDIGASSDSPNLVSGSCRIELNIIVGRLQATFDLSQQGQRPR